MKTVLCTAAAAALVALAAPAAALASDEHAKEGEHACPHPKSGVVSTSGDAAAKGEQVVIPVDGMHCGNCAERVTAALAKVKGVKFVETSLDAKQAKVVYDGKKAKQAALAGAIRDAGYAPGKPRVN